MAFFTMTLQEFLETNTIGLDKYPIFDEGYRTPLNNKIIDHYMFYEIGQETTSMFRFFINRKMNEIMPYYNQLYESARIKFDPLLTMDLRMLVDAGGSSTTTNANHIIGGVNSTVNGSSDSSATTHSDNASENKSRAVTSDTPQTQLSGNSDYASGLADSTSTGTSTTDSNSDSHTTDTTSSVSDTSSDENSTGNLTHNANTDSVTRGRNAPAQDLIMSWRDSFLNIDMEVIDELTSQFMGVWQNTDQRANSSGLNTFGFMRYPFYN